jgi:hypothetical protein
MKQRFFSINHNHNLGKRVCIDYQGHDNINGSLSSEQPESR